MFSSPIKAIIFDMDGTLANTIGAITTAINQMLLNNGFPPHTEEEVRSYVGNGGRMLVKRALPSAISSDETAVDLYFNLYNAEYKKCFLKTDQLYPDLGDVIRDLSNHYLIGVLSNKDDFILRPLVQQLLSPYCSSFYVQGPSPSLPTKPDRLLTQTLLDSMGVQPEECIMIGDSDVDKRTADNAHMLHIGVTWGFRDEIFLKGHGVINLVHTPNELYSKILELS